MIPRLCPVEEANRLGGEATVRHRDQRSSAGSQNSRDLPEHLAGIDEIQDDLLSVGRYRGDLHPALDHRHHAVAGGAFPDNDVALRKFLHSRKMRKFIERLDR